ncbi:DDE-type integrase/transposase/recombinase [Paraburkholderia bannensis]|uniref:DDE-type integrase/transposase/recombinase n=1 Tax=Paraburkholderia bannensis TaxID=765414 RepID=UPI002AAF9F47|nr:DDE-type integrase/transposase/recombinase [Paraburkholderia bannensis]
MLNKAQLTEVFDRLGTPAAGRDLILNARIQAPVREVVSRGGNVITILASKKMGREIRTESRHIEFAVAVTKEHAEDVLEYYAQPCDLKLKLVNDATGEIRTISHIPDFLTIGHDGFTLEEWKSETKLTRLAEKYPYRYAKDSDGQWYSPQIEKQVAELGIRYKLCSEGSIPRRRVENLLYLADYFLPGAEPCSEDTLTRLNTALREHGSLSFHDLLSSPHNFDADFLNQAIADNLAVTDLDHDSLAEKRLFRLYRDVAVRDFSNAALRSGSLPREESFALDIAEGSKFLFEGRELTMLVVGEEFVICKRQDDSTIQLTREWIEEAHERKQITAVHAVEKKSTDLSCFSEKDLKDALARQALLNSPSDQKCIASRTLRRWAARRLVALANGDNEILALVPNTKGKGNRTPRLSRRQLELMDHIIDTEWKSSNAINYTTCHRKMKVAFEEAAEPCPSLPTMIAHIKARKTNEDVRTRLGKRIAYQEQTFIDVLYYDSPAHGNRPLQYVHIDHTQLDIEVISSKTGKSLGRPWLSLAVDAWSRRIVAIYLTFDSPSYTSSMMVIRDLVRRFNRLPEFIIVDNGSDFLSDAFKSFLRVMGTHLRFRPAGRPRHGAVLERMFGRLNTEYIHNLDGNTKATKNVRMVTGSHLPKKLAEWTLHDLYYGIQHWAFEFYDQNEHPALDDSPRATFLRGLRENGSREQRRITFDRDFLIATCPPVDRTGMRQVHPQRGVKVDNRFYWNELFQDSKVAKKSFPVRYDPWNASTVYVLIKDQWVRAICRNLHGLGQMTDVEQKAVTAEFNRRSNTVAGDEKSAQRLREFLEVFTPEGAVALEMERQSENKNLWSELQLASVEPIAPADMADFSRSHIPQTKPIASQPAQNKTTDIAIQARPKLPDESPRANHVESDHSADDDEDFEDF